MPHPKVSYISYSNDSFWSLTSTVTDAKLIIIALKDYKTDVELDRFPASTVVHSEGNEKSVNISEALLAAHMASPVKRKYTSDIMSCGILTYI